MRQQNPPASNNKNFILLDDAPYTGEPDPFEFKKYAQGLTKLIRKSKDATPMTIGIQAPWGMGKSTLMYKLKKQLDQYQNKGIHTVWFNAWIFEGKDVLEGLIKSVLQKVDSNILRRTLRNKKFMAALHMVASIIASWFRLDKVVDDFWEAISVDPRVRNQMLSVLKDAMNEWISTAPRTENERLLVVFIDDLDRCSPANVFHVFEAIKLYLDAPGFVFIIGFDQSIISESILEYKKYSEKITSRHYIEKIIQIDYNIPRPDEIQIQNLFKLCVKASRTQNLLQENEEKLIVEQSDRNPRRIKRFINRFILEQQLGEDTDTLAPELLIKMLMIQLYFRDFYALFHDQAEKNLITEFLDYLETWKALRSETALTSNKVQEVLNFYGLDPPVEASYLEATQKALEESVPEEFALLSQNNEFISLIQSIKNEEDREILAQRILRKREAGDIETEIAQEAESEEARRREVSLAGLRILWVYGHPKEMKEARDLIEHVKELGGRIEVAPDTEMAFSFLNSRADWANVIIMNMRQKEMEKIGFEDVQKFKADGLYDGPVILFVKRVTPILRKNAEAIHVYGITNVRTKVIELLQSLVEIQQAEMKHAV